MACLYPGAPNLDTFWGNILGGVDATSDPPPEAWDRDLYYDPDASSTDRIYCKRGGYLGPLSTFDPLANGVPPVAVGGEPDQWLALQVARDALADAGSAQVDAERRPRTSVVLGKGTYLNRGNLSMVQHGLVVSQTVELLRRLHPEHTDEELEALRRELLANLPPVTPETVPGLIPNIIVGRIANRLDLMGPSYTVDAACASSLIAVQQALRDLADGECDLAIVGGSQVSTALPVLNVFCQLGALSRRQQIRPFDKDADGTLLGEGIGILVLKRLADAERDGDRIYAVIRGVGVASDGRGVSVMAPRLEGEVLALERAYAAAGVDPRSVGLIEAHGTGTPVGDVVEVQALARVFGPRQGPLPRTALGSVKSMISHTMPASGAAGLIKTALALYHKVLPPTLNVTEPNPRLELEKTPFYLNTATRPWVHAGPAPRRAGVNAFGFGGINAHVVLEEYVPPAGAAATPTGPRAAHRPDWDAEVCVLEAATAAELAAQAARLASWLAERASAATPAAPAPSMRDAALKDATLLAHAARAASPGAEPPRLRDVAYTLARRLRGEGRRLAVVATSLADLQAKLTRAAQRLGDPRCRQLRDASGIYYAAEPLGRQGKLALLFPGEGSQYPGMLADLCLHFPEVRACFDQMDRVFREHPRGYVPSDYIFPRPAFSAAEGEWADRRLWQMDGAVESVPTANHAIFGLLQRLGLRPDALVGHSTGEYSAMWAARIIDVESDENLRRFALGLNAGYRESSSHPGVEGVPPASLLAIGAERARVEAIAREAANGAADGPATAALSVAMDNCPHQAVLVGLREPMERALAVVRREGLIYQQLAFDRPYHTPLFEPYAAGLREFFQAQTIQPPRTTTYSCTTAAPYPADPDAIRELAVEHWSKPVEFVRTIRTMHADGVRVFVEAGPRGNLTAFVGDILRGEPHVAVAANVPQRSGLSQLCHLVGLLTAQGVPLDVGYLFAHRDAREAPLPDLSLAAEPAPSGGPGTRAGGRASRLKLLTGWPELGVSDETVARLREAGRARAGAAAAAEPASPPADGSAPGAPVAGAPPSPVATPPRPAPPSPEPAEPPAEPALPTQTPPAPPATAAAQPAPSPAAPERPSVAPAPLTTRAPTVQPPRPAPAVRVAGSRPAAGPALQAYMQTMQQFLAAERQVLAAYLTSRPAPRGVAAPAGPARRPAPGARFPLLGEVVSLAPGRELVARRRVHLGEDLYLKDHTLGVGISTTDPELRALPVVPLTMSVEMLAEAGAALVPDRALVGMREVHANRWIALEDDEVVLETVARRLATPPGAPAEVAVEVRELAAGVDGAAGSPAPASLPLVEGVVLFAESYPPPPPREPFALRGERPSGWRPEALYTRGMFHGPAWRGVTTCERWGEDGMLATLQGTPTGGFLASDPRPAFVTDPVVLDAAGQVVGFWTQEHLARGFVVFPFRVEELRLYGPSPASAPGHASGVRCEARIRLVGEEQTRTDFDLYYPDGRPWLRLGGWWDKRFDAPLAFYHFLLAPRREVPSELWPLPVSPFAGRSGATFAGFRAADPFERDRAFWQRIWAHVSLTRDERAAFRRLRGPAVRVAEWLAARAAAKDAVRTLLRGRGLDLCPADVAIVDDEHGRPVPRGGWEAALREPVALSIAHADGVAAAVAGLGPGAAGLGLDLEPIRSRPAGFEELAFREAERRLLDELAAGGPPGLRDEWLTRLWCAKEAVAKGLGRGLVEGPQSVEALAASAASGTVAVALRGALAAAFPDLAGARLLAYTWREEGLAVASTLCESE